MFVIPRHRWALFALALLPLLGGCGGHHATAPTPSPDPLALMPAPTTPSEAGRALEWVWNNRTAAGYTALFTSDFTFVFAALDTNGNPFPDHEWGRADELSSFSHLVNGGNADQPAASQITLVFDQTFNVQNDTRDGKYDPDRRKSITTQVNLTLTTVDGASANVNGKVTFYLVRGDSAAIPAGLGLHPDPNRWYIERWEDYTYAPYPGLNLYAPQPTKTRTWGSIKSLYL